VPFGPRYFEIDGQRIPLNRDPRRLAWRYERSVEVPLALDAYRRHDPADVLEVGNVLHLYGARRHTVVDKYEIAPGVMNEDIVEFRPGRRYSLVVTVSTLEHVGWDEDPIDADKAAAALEVVSELGDALFATIPVGYHRAFEDVFVSGPFEDVTLMVRRSRLGRWEQRPVGERTSVRFGQPYTAGNGVLIGTRGERPGAGN
jgi:hypothetical protein